MIWGVRRRTTSSSAILALAAALGGCASAGGAGPTEAGPQAATEPGAVAEPGLTTEAAAPFGRAAVEALEFPPLEFEPPSPERFELSNGVTVFLLEDHALPLVSLQARFEGGTSSFGREDLGAATGLGGLLRTGGTDSLPPDSVDALVEFYALDVGFGTGGQSSTASLGTLRQHFERGVALWADLIRNPRFDDERVDVWRERELEFVRRREDNPAFHAATEFNRILYGDHPVGWVLGEEDLQPDDVDDATLHRLHRAIYCPGNATFGVTGDIGRAEATRLLEEAFAGWEACSGELREPPDPDIREGAGVFFIQRDLNQSTVYMAHGGGVTRSSDRDYFASRIANRILGGGGFTSRIMNQVRSEHGYAYSAASFWNAPADHEGAFGAQTATRSESTIAAIELIQQIMADLGRAPPEAEEVQTAIDDVVNGFVFNFENPASIVSRQMYYHVEEMPSDWLERYIEGIQQVTPEDVQQVAERYIDPGRLTILILGDEAALDQDPAVLGEVTRLEGDDDD